MQYFLPILHLAFTGSERIFLSWRRRVGSEKKQEASTFFSTPLPALSSLAPPILLFRRASQVWIWYQSWNHLGASWTSLARESSQSQTNILTSKSRSPSCLEGWTSGKRSTVDSLYAVNGELNASSEKTLSLERINTLLGIKWAECRRFFSLTPTHSTRILFTISFVLSDKTSWQSTISEIRPLPLTQWGGNSIP